MTDYIKYKMTEDQWEEVANRWMERVPEHKRKCDLCESKHNREYNICKILLLDEEYYRPYFRLTCINCGKVNFHDLNILGMRHIVVDALKNKKKKKEVSEKGFLERLKFIFKGE